jgi:3-oxoacyl-[acyl-carrier-protein] synthase II
VATPAGCDLTTFWQNLTAGHSAVGRIRRFDVSAYPTQIAAEVHDFGVLNSQDFPPQLSDLGLISRFAFQAARSALEDSRLLRKPINGARVGVLVAAGLGNYDHQEAFAPCWAAACADHGTFDWRIFVQQLRKSLKRRAPERRSPGSVPALIAQSYKFAGPVMCVMTACSAGTQALGDAARWIRTGMADVVLAGGSDSEIYPMGLASFCLLRALSTRNQHPTAASRPFDATRDGFVLGEGAGILLLEELEHARRRGAHIYAEVAGFGSACDSYRVTDPHPEGKGALLAMERALGNAGIDPSQIDYINAHGTSTVLNDRIETYSIRKIFGGSGRRVPVSSTKSIIGHLTVAAGAVEAITTTLTLTSQIIHPTINYQVPDPECELDCVPNHARSADITYALSNSFAFGGQCACLILRRYPA